MAAMGRKRSRTEASRSGRRYGMMGTLSSEKVGGYAGSPFTQRSTSSFKVVWQGVSGVNVAVISSAYGWIDVGRGDWAVNGRGTRIPQPGDPRHEPGPVGGASGVGLLPGDEFV